MNRRDFFAVLGGGVVVMLLDDDLYAQETGGRGRGPRQLPQDLGAWLHIGETGIVTVYSGKVEVGQNARTSLTQAVAEELRAPVASIRMVMADTELTPYDMGTVGSQTTPQMWPVIRRAAAAARETLIDLASQKWMVDRSAIQVADGKVTAGSRSAGFGELTHGQKLTRTISSERRAGPRRPNGRWPERRCPRSTGARWSPARTNTPTTPGFPGCCTGRCCIRRRSAPRWCRSIARRRKPCRA